MRLCALFVVPLFTPSCDCYEEPLKGMWQLQQIATTDTTLYDNAVYYSFDQGVFFLQNSTLAFSCYGSYSHIGTQLAMRAVTYDNAENLSKHYYWGNSFERCFEIETLTTHTLKIGVSDTLYTFRKF